MDLQDEDVANNDDVHAVLGHYVFSLFLALKGLITGGIDQEPKTTPGRLVVLGFGFFVLVTLASFTANTAAFLIGQHTTFEVNSITASLAAGHKICVPQLQQKMALMKYPALATNMVTATDARDVLKKLRDNECQAALGSAKWLHLAQMCGWTVVGDVELQEMIGFYAAAPLAPALGALMPALARIGPSALAKSLAAKMCSRSK